MSTNVLVMGATGHQGSAVIAGLTDLPDRLFTIYALTRNVSSPGAQRLQSKYPNVKLVAGSFEEPSAIFAACDAQISHVFAVQLPTGFPPDAETEERHGKALVDAAASHSVKFYVQASVDRGVNSDTDPTDVPHFISKFNIEKHLIDVVGQSNGNISYTILRPTSFMDNLGDGGFPAKVTATAWRDALPSTLKVQVIAVKDIGRFAARALAYPDRPEYHNQAISLAGDEVSWDEMNQMFAECTGQKNGLPTTFSIVPRLLFKLVPEMALTFRFFEVKGFSADISRLRLLDPQIMTFRSWLEDKVSTGSLARG